MKLIHHGVPYAPGFRLDDLCPARKAWIYFSIPSILHPLKRLGKHMFHQMKWSSGRLCASRRLTSILAITQQAVEKAKRFRWDPSILGIGVDTKTVGMTESETIGGILETVRKCGNIIGCRLLSDDSQKKSKRYEFYLRRIAFVITILFYLFGLATVTLTMIPFPGDGKGWKFNFSTAFAIMWSFLYVDGLASFVCLNRSSVVLNREGGFCSQYRENFSNSKICPKGLRRWIRITKGTMLVSTNANIVTVTVAVCYVAGILSGAFPVDIDRASKWLSMPPIMVKAILQILKCVTAIHIEYHNLLFSSLCELARAHLSTYCRKLSRESAGTFCVRRLGKYQRDFGRLAELISCLDDAFKHSCLCQLALFIGTMCLIGFIFVKETLEPITLFVLLYSSLLIIVTFLYTGVPATLLKAEVSADNDVLT